MDFWNRLIGSTLQPKKQPSRPAAHDPQARLARFKRVYHSIHELSNKPRNVENEGPLLDSLNAHINRIAALLREETRAPAPHLCIQYSGSNHIYAFIGRAATVSSYEPIIRSSIAVFAALVDSEEENFLENGNFAKSLMRLVRKVLESGGVLIDTETETSIMELLFTISAKIRLQPEILPVWFQSTAKPELEDVFVKEKKSFVGITQKDDFPLCYLMIDRVHHEGRIGDFARTGLLYIYESTGRSLALEEWVVSSDLPTLMASGLGALYSQLSRELSILHPDATLPAVLAMSDYSTTHPRATAESAFSERHKSHMATFLHYLHFWQDVLDHCKSADVKQTLLDHFQILFLQQLLYPSLLQSSDTDAGSSIAVLTYMTVILEYLEYPDLIHIMLTYLLAIQENQHLTVPSAPETPVRADGPPRSPTSVKRRQSLMLLSTPKNPDDAVDPNLFNLVDLILNNVSSQNSQAVFAALKLISAVLTRQKKYAFGTLLKVVKGKPGLASRTIGALDEELEAYSELAISLHRGYALDNAYQGLCEDTRFCIEAQVQLKAASVGANSLEEDASSPEYLLQDADPLLRTLIALLSTFFTNSVDVNLALSQAIISIAQCIELRVEGFLALASAAYQFAEDASGPTKPWQAFLDEEEKAGWISMQQAERRPIWPEDNAPSLHVALRALTQELEHVRMKVPNLDQLIAGRKNMLQAASLDASESEAPSLMMSGPTAQPAHLDVPPTSSRGHSRNSSRSSTARGRANTSDKAANAGPLSAPSSASASRGASRAASRPPTSQHITNAEQLPQQQSIPSPPGNQSIFKPPPPETPSTTDVLMQTIHFDDGSQEESNESVKRAASLNHVLTNVVVLQEFILELVAVLQVRAAILGEGEARSTVGEVAS
ncbi:hypothetical protein PRZ48_005673 [Zasmidium cellare]|uniref:Retinoic acid induced 16-like protein-domain-containing protein n=1 Tax=Zasmidium cellare TaxID=395010 RepID=A0ABR0EM10_ZASCE|nr:hypothetical protein PRZ48_005673 [Zasmidium cellare]